MVTMVPVRGGRVTPYVKAAISINPATGASAPVWAAVAVGVRGCPLCRLLPCCLPRQLELIVSVIVGRNRAIGATGAQSLELCRRRTCCICRRCCCFYLCPYCCQFCHRQPCCPCRRRYSLYRRSLAFLCRSNLGLLSVLHARGNRALRLSFGHDALVGDCYVGKRLPQTSCSSVQERRDEQEQPVLLLPTEDRGRRGKGMGRRYLGCRIERL
jgi:hypothetical protein